MAVVLFLNLEYQISNIENISKFEPGEILILYAGIGLVLAVTYARNAFVTSIRNHSVTNIW